MKCVRAGLAFGAVLAVIAAGAQGVSAYGAPSPLPLPSASPDRAHSISAEQSRAVSAAQALGLGTGEKLVVKDVITDGDGSTHVRYDRTFNGLRVIGGDLVSHRDRAGKIKSVTWNTSPRVAVASTTPRLSLASARTAGAKVAALAQDAPAASAAELVLYAGGLSPKAKPTLAYDVLSTGVRADQTPSRLHTIVDAGTGATLTSWDEIGTGTGNGIYVGQVPIGTTRGPAPAAFSMRDASGNVTTDLLGKGDGSGIDVENTPGRTFTDTDDLWGNGSVSNRASAAVAAHYGAEKTFSYYKSVLGRNGIWNTGVGARSRVHYGVGFVNAFWDGKQMTYGDGAANKRPLVALDVAGHEMTHGVTENTAGLVIDGEAGGLNEATSDIFGTAVEWFANNAKDRPDYLIGEMVNINGNGTPLRYLDRPSRDNASPDCWSSAVGNLDPHLSSGPLNHWFYLASEGSGSKVLNGVSYTSPTCNASTVKSIGRDKAAKIWYRTLSTYLTSNSGYAAAREGAIQSAKDLYGAASPECAGIAASFSAIAVRPGAQTCSIAPVAALGSNLLRNPGFESGNVLWSASPIVVAQNGALQPAHSGKWNAWMGGIGDGNIASISQLVTIPAGRRATLTYYVHVETAEVSRSSALDKMTVRAGATVLQTLSNLNAANGYRRKTVDLSAYAGRTIVLSLKSVENINRPTSFVVDDLSVTTAWIAPRLVFSPLDFSGDGRSDILTVRSTGDLYLRRGNGSGGFTGAPVSVGAGWGIFTKVFSPRDFTGDGRSDIVAVRTNGDLYLYRGNGSGGFAGAPTRIGAGWGAFTNVFSPGDFTGDGMSDILAVRSSGDLLLFRGNGLGGFTGSGARIGTGWGAFTKIFSAGDFTGDGKADLLAVKSTGDMLLYRGSGRGGFTGSGTKIGTGWGPFVKVLSAGDSTGDGKSDILALKSNGDLRLYRGNGSGGFTGLVTTIATGMN